MKHKFGIQSFKRKEDVMGVADLTVRSPHRHKFSAMHLQVKCLFEKRPLISTVTENVKKLLE